MDIKRSNDKERCGMKRGNEGYLAKTFAGVLLPLELLVSRAGFYVGTATEEGPFTRESEEYWATREEAEAALAAGSWTQRLSP
jgi:hypothetical protein